MPKFFSDILDWNPNLAPWIALKFSPNPFLRGKWGFWLTFPVLSVRFEVGVSLVLAPARADKRGRGPFSFSGKCRNAASDLQESTSRSSGGSRISLKALLSNFALKILVFWFRLLLRFEFLVMRKAVLAICFISPRPIRISSLHIYQRCAI